MSYQEPHKKTEQRHELIHFSSLGIVFSLEMKQRLHHGPVLASVQVMNRKMDWPSQDKLPYRKYKVKMPTNRATEAKAERQ